jgi:hypothetical protein
MKPWSLSICCVEWFCVGRAPNFGETRFSVRLEHIDAGRMWSSRTESHDHELGSQNIGKFLNYLISPFLACHHIWLWLTSQGMNKFYKIK